ncbi:MAG: hypothetical protein HY236_03245 [Acidobacteria bacterium]|nr:hypothetical protein [Acidobacteriota bacterium]
MGSTWFRGLVLSAVGVSLLAAPQTAAARPAGGATVSGVFMGRSGKPMGKSRLFLGVVEKDEETLFAGIRLGKKPPSALTDDSGNFQFTGITPGKYVILYEPPPNAQVVPPEQFDIKKLQAVIPSFLPMLKNLEVGKTGPPFPNRPWGGREFLVLKGHTLKTVEMGGSFMKIWNATVRRGLSGPYVEMRNGVVEQHDLADKGQIKLEAWSY